LRVPPRRSEDCRPRPVGENEGRIGAAMLPDGRKTGAGPAWPAPGREPLRNRRYGALTAAPAGRQSGGELVNVHNSVIFLPPCTGSIRPISARFSTMKSRRGFRWREFV
jgi:hypothetical protein